MRGTTRLEAQDTQRKANFFLVKDLEGRVIEIAEASN